MRNIFSRNIYLIPFAFVASHRILSSRSIVTMSSSNHQLVLDAFGARQFNNPDYTGTQISFSEVEFEKLVNKAYTEGATLVDGYAPFWYASFIDVSTTTVLFYQIPE